MDIYLQFLSTITFVRRVNLYSYFIFVMVNLIPNYSMSKSKYVFAFLSYTVFHHLLVPPSLFLSFKYDNCRSFMRHSILKNNLFPFPSKYQHNFQDSPTKCSNLTPSQPAFPQDLIKNISLLVFFLALQTNQTKKPNSASFTFTNQQMTRQSITILSRKLQASQRRPYFYQQRLGISFLKLYELHYFLLMERNKKKVVWTQQELILLTKLYPQFASKKWKRISQELSKEGFTRSQTEVRERWVNFMDPQVNKREWEEWQLQILYDIHDQVGTKWCLIQKYIGRAQNMIKNRFYGTLRNLIRFLVYHFGARRESFNRRISRLSPKILNNIYLAEHQFSFIGDEIKEAIYQMRFKVDKKVLTERFRNKRWIYDKLKGIVCKIFDDMQLPYEGSPELQDQESVSESEQQDRVKQQQSNRISESSEESIQKGVKGESEQEIYHSLDQEEEMKSKEEEMKSKEEEMKPKEEEMKPKEEEMKPKEEEMKPKEDDGKIYPFLPYFNYNNLESIYSFSYYNLQ